MDNESLTNRQKQAIETKQRIFDTTIRLINEIDLNKITIRRICKEANISVGTFYVYFKSKEDILLEIYKDVDEIYMKSNIQSRNDLNSLEKIKEVIKIQMDFTLSIDINILKQLYASHMYSDNKFFFSEKRVVFLALNSIIQDGQKSKEIIDNIPSNEISWKILRFSRGIIFDWLIHDGNYGLEETAIKELLAYLNIFKYN